MGLLRQSFIVSRMAFNIPTILPARSTSNRSYRSLSITPLPPRRQASISCVVPAPESYLPSIFSIEKTVLPAETDYVRTYVSSIITEGFFSLSPILSTATRI